MGAHIEAYDGDESEAAEVPSLDLSEVRKGHYHIENKDCAYLCESLHIIDKAWLEWPVVANKDDGSNWDINLAH